MQLDVLWRWSIKELMVTSPSPYLDAELLLAAHLRCTRIQLYTQAVSTAIAYADEQLIKASVKRRKAGEPIAYLIGQRAFWSLSFEVSPAVLIPRPETELLVELALTSLANEEKRLADLGTGSGAIALALATERPAWQIIATDVSYAALQLAERNRQRYQLENVELRQGDWCDAFWEGECFDAIVSNPPYLVCHDPHFQSELGLAFEPKTALIADENGLKHLETIICQARYYLVAGGILLVEHGYEQALLVRQFFLKYGYHTLRHHKDLADKQRVTSGKWH
jgi:release factor glutamine methyltransferase